MLASVDRLGENPGMKCWVLVCGVLVACGKVSSKSPDAAVGGDGPRIDSPKPIDASTICNPTGTFDAPVVVTNYASTTDTEQTSRLSPDELTMYISGRWNGATTTHIYSVTRAATSDNFSAPPTELAIVNSTANDWDPTISSDGKTLMFGSQRNANDGNDLFIATRTSTAADFGTPALIANGNSLTDDDTQPFLTADGQELWFASNRSGTAGAHDIYRSVAAAGSFGTPVRVAEVSSAGDEFLPVLSADKLTIYFATTSTGPGTKGGFDIWTAHRATATDPFASPSVVTELNSAGNDAPGWLSSDNCRLYFWSDTAGSSDLYVATRHP